MDGRTGTRDRIGALEQIDGWPVPTAAVAVLRREGDPTGRGPARVLTVGGRGPQRHVFPLASVTKPLVAYAVLVAVEEGALDYDDPAGPEGSTVRHLLAHASGLAFASRRSITAPGRRRVYSNTGFEVLGETLERATGIGLAAYLAEAVTVPLGMGDTRLEGSAGAGCVSTLADMRLFAAELLVPTLVHPSTLARATTVAFPGLSGVLPGYGVADPNDWGLGFELRDHKPRHWTGRTSDPATFGHFGRSGTFLWVDPAADAACVCLTDRDFGDWAIAAWPRLTDAVLAELRG